MMGYGDSLKKTAYQPVGSPIRCDVSGMYFHPCAIRKCPDEAVVRRYGVGGVANVSVWICRKCRNAVIYKYHGGVRCVLEGSTQ